MHKSTTRPFIAVALAQAALLIMLSLAGCSQTAPTLPHGVLSTIHQKTLAVATERAAEQAGLAKNELGTDRVFLSVAPIPDTDLGKRHCARVITDCIKGVSAGVVDNASDADRQLDLDILTAGVDVKHGALLGFSWLETMAEIKIRVKSVKGAASPEEREGGGTAVFQQVWWFGIGPTEKLK